MASIAYRVGLASALNASPQGSFRAPACLPLAYRLSALMGPPEKPWC